MLPCGGTRLWVDVTTRSNASSARSRCSRAVRSRDELLVPRDGDPSTVFTDMSLVVAGAVGCVATIGGRVDGPALLYEGQVNMLFGDPEAGKSWVACYVAAQQPQGGGTRGKALVWQGAGS